jgi:hypothetical protein
MRVRNEIHGQARHSFFVTPSYDGVCASKVRGPRNKCGVTD